MKIEVRNKYEVKKIYIVDNEKQQAKVLSDCESSDKETQPTVFFKPIYNEVMDRLFLEIDSFEVYSTEKYHIWYGRSVEKIYNRLLLLPNELKKMWFVHYKNEYARNELSALKTFIRRLVDHIETCDEVHIYDMGTEYLDGTSK